MLLRKRITAKQLSLLAYVFSIEINRAYSEWDVDKFPHPGTDPDKCGNAGSHICDPDSVLTMPQRLALNDNSKLILSKTRERISGLPYMNSCLALGFDIFLVFVKRVSRLPGNSKTIGSAELAKLAKKIKMAWGLNSKVCDNVLMILFSKEDKQIFSLAGEHTRISRVAADTIFHNNKFYFTDRKYFEGIQFMMRDFEHQWYTEVRNFGTGVKPRAVTEHPKTPYRVPWWVWLVLIMLVVPSLICCCLCLCFAPCKCKIQTDKEESETSVARKLLNSWYKRRRNSAQNSNSTELEDPQNYSCGATIQTVQHATNNGTSNSNGQQGIVMDNILTYETMETVGTPGLELVERISFDENYDVEL